MVLFALKTGDPVPGVSIKPKEDKLIQLKDFKGKYVVLDFWGTWWPPCLQGFEKMKEYYYKFQDKIEFIAIACNDTDSAWRSVIKDYNLPWSQVLSVTGTNDLEIKYNIETYPTKILIDKEGNLVHIFKGEQSDF